MEQEPPDIARDREQGGDCVVVGGETFPLRFAAWDRDTYRHREGCLAFPNRKDSVCQCGALDRTSKIMEAANGITVLVPAPADGWRLDG